MKKVGIIAAMQEEMNEVKKMMTDIKEIQVYELTFIEGIINNSECVLIQCGVGKVNAARTTQIMLDKYDIDYVINVGSAGTTKEELNIGDIVVAEKVVQHDFDITAFGHKKGYISNVGDYILSDENLVNKIMNCKITDNTVKIKRGIVASGDIFCTEEYMKNKIKSKFNADAVEMEGAAIAQVCYLDKTPFVIIRSISDSPNGNNAITFEQFLETASKRCAELLKTFI